MGVQRMLLLTTVSRKSRTYITDRYLTFAGRSAVTWTRLRKIHFCADPEPTKVAKVRYTGVLP